MLPSIMSSSSGATPLGQLPSQFGTQCEAAGQAVGKVETSRVAVGHLLHGLVVLFEVGHLHADLARPRRKKQSVPAAQNVSAVAAGRQKPAPADKLQAFDSEQDVAHSERFHGSSGPSWAPQPFLSSGGKIEAPASVPEGLVSAPTEPTAPRTAAAEPEFTGLLRLLGRAGT